MPDQQAPQAKEIHTRLLYPFLFDLGKDNTAALADKLCGLRITSKKKGKVAVWQACDIPVEQTPGHQDHGGKGSPAHAQLSRYNDELTPTVRNFLFPKGGAEGCHYLRIEEQAQRWFRSAVQVHFHDQALFAARLDTPRIEVFLSRYGAGVLSIALQAEAGHWQDADDGIALQELKHFNYRLAQTCRARTVPTLGIPHPTEKSADGQAPPAHANIPPAPAEDAPLTQRLGASGGRYTLPELVEFLLGPVLDSPGFTRPQENFSVYSVVRFGHEVNLGDRQTRDQLGPLLAGLAQVEEPGHAGAVPGEPLDLPNALMNSCQWAAVGAQGATHLVADQHDPPRDFDQQRVSQYRDKYFIAYLLAQLQRLTLQRAAVDAAQAIAGSDGQQRRDAFHALHGDLLDFSVAAHYTEISSRHAVNRFYHLAQQGLGVDTALTTVTEAVRSHESRQISHESRQISAEARQIGNDMASNVDTISHVQRKVEWLEIFFVSFYATELANLISERAFSHAYGTGSVLVAPFVAGALAAWGLQPWKRDHVDVKRRSRFIAFGLLAVVIVAWLAVGFVFFPQTDAHAAPAHSDVSDAAVAKPAGEKGSASQTWTTPGRGIFLPQHEAHSAPDDVPAAGPNLPNASGSPHGKPTSTLASPRGLLE